MRGQIFTRRCELEISFVRGVANELFQENWSFEPPVAKQFRIERRDDNRCETSVADLLNLLPALVQKVDCVLRGRIFGCVSIIELLLVIAARDSVIFHSREFSRSARDRSQMFDRQVETDI